MDRKYVVKKSRSERKGERMFKRQERKGGVSSELRRGDGMAKDEAKDRGRNVYNPLKTQRKQNKLVRKANAAGASISGAHKTELGPPRDESKKSGRKYNRVVKAMKKYKDELAKMGKQAVSREEEGSGYKTGGVRLPSGNPQRRRRTRRAS